MKKITSIFALLLCVFVFSCSNDDDKETSSLQIVSSNVTFESAGGTGTIKVNAISEITATSNKDWCTVSVNGDIINVSVIENNDMSGRTAAVTITDGEASTLVPVSQGGCVILYNKSELGHAFTYAGGSATVSFSTTASYSIEVPAEAQSWLSYTLDEENRTITFNVAASADKTPRGAAVKVTTGKKTIYYHLGEYELKDIAGKWRVSFVDGNDSTLAGEIEVVQDEEEPTIFYLSGISNFFDLPLIYNGEALLTMGGLNLGTYAGRYNIYTVTLSEGGYVSWDMSTQYVAYPSSINGKFALVFGDNGSWDGDVVNGIAYWAFSGAAGTGSAGWLEKFNALTLSK